MKTVLHVLDHSLPVQSGYSSRSHSILRSLKNSGINASALTSPKHEGPGGGIETIDDVSYMRCPALEGQSTTGIRGQIDTIMRTRRMLGQLRQGGDIGLIHAHSPCLNGLAAVGFGIPFVYEMRSSWEDAAVSEGVTSEGSLRYRISRALETFVAKRADHVFVICNGLRDELVSRGLAQGKVTVVPNALPEFMFDTPRVSDISSIAENLGIADRRVIGFFGSFFDWEGIDTLVHAMPEIIAAVPDALLLLVGGGRAETKIRGLVSHKKLENSVSFVGRVHGLMMPAYYHVADVMVYPRISHRLTEMVTPLKPLEAMAQGTPVVASDIGGHRELIEHGVTGFLFSLDEPSAIARQIIDILEGDNSGVVSAARRYVQGQRRWSVIAERYLPVYEHFGISATSQ
jgi:PEP-CTERM/exosortase A-associated glycosyltransferase